ncbi:MAG: thiamine pyrophosphate-binding protein [Pseudomonadota bacterium]
MRTTLGAQISHFLKDRGVDVIFGIPGVHNQELYRGIEEAGITHVLARHEQGAGFMADGYARATGMPGVAYVISGPGLTNIMTPMGQAYSDSVPMLVISSCLDETAATRGQLHQMKDQRAAAEAVCDWSEEARTAEAAYALIDRALAELHSQRARPKHIQVPIAQLESAAEEFERWGLGESWKNADKFEVRKIPAPIKSQSFASFEDSIAQRLMQAERPLFVFGGGAAFAGQKLVSSVLDKTRSASFVTYAGRGVVPLDNPLSFGSNLARPDSAKLLEASDCVVFVGTDMAEVDLWRTRPGHRPGTIWVNTDTEVLARAHPQDTCLESDAGDVLSRIDMALTGTPKSGWSSDIIAGYRDRWRAEIDAQRPGIVPVIDALRAALPDDTMIYSDMTQFAYCSKEIWDMPHPRHWHHPTGFGTLGYALPAGIGGAVARRGQPTAVIAGDYGFQYTMQELGTAVELSLALPVILWDNGKLKEIEDSMVHAQIAPNAVIARNPDFCRLASAFGAAAVRPTSLDDIGPAVSEALGAHVPTLIHLTPDIL